MMGDQISREVMDERLEKLQQRITEHQLAFNRSKVGSDTQIMIDRKGRASGQMVGKTPWLQSVHVEADAPIGAMLDVTLTSAGPNSLGGALRTAVAA
jgi:tRNA-2-methylthio-N6-dimethylallyladenosine synthase